MTRERVKRILTPSAALAALTLALVLLGMALTAQPARAAGTVVRTSGAVTEFGNDVVVPRGDQVKSVVAFGGDVTVNGAVQQGVVAIGGDVTVPGRVGQNVVAIGGDVTVSGAVRKSVVAVGGDIHLQPTASVGAGQGAGASSIVLAGGSVTRAPGAQVMGRIKVVHRGHVLGALGVLGSPALLTHFGWFGWSLTGWIVQTAIFLVLALVAAALLPKQLLAVQRHLVQRPAASLGWGALSFFVIVPVALLILVLTVIGIFVAVPLLVIVLLAYFFAVTGVAAMLAQRLLASGGGRKQNLMAAVALGVVGTTLVSRLPVAGPVVLLAMTLFGTGAAALSLFEWRRARGA